MSYYEGLGIPYGLATTPSKPVPEPESWWQQFTKALVAPPASTGTPATGGAAVVPGITPTPAAPDNTKKMLLIGGAATAALVVVLVALKK